MAPKVRHYETIAVCISTAQKKALKDLAAKTGKNQSEIVREMFDKVFDEVRLG